MRNAFCFLSVALAAGLAASSSQALTFDLATDFSSVNNPNGRWSFVYNGSPLGHVSAPTANGNPLIPAIGADGYFSTGPNLNDNTPDVLKAAVNGSAAGGNDLDFLAGDIVIHSPNDGTPLAIVWTAPAAGKVTFRTDFWYAHSSVTRSNDVTMFVNDQAYSFPTQTNKTVNFDRSGVGSFFSPFNTPLDIAAGGTLRLEFTKSAGQQFGSLSGLDFSGEFTATMSGVPEASTWVLMLSGFAGLGLLGLRQSRRESASAA